MTMEQEVVEAMSRLAEQGPGRAAAAVEREDGTTMMVEVVVHDVTGWEQEQ